MLMNKIANAKNILSLVVHRILLVFMVLFGLILSTLAASNIYTNISSKGWPTVPGVIVGTEVIKTNGRGQCHMWPKWTYVYTVDGRQYAGHNRTFRNEKCYLFREGAEDALASNPVGTYVSIIYDPKYPKTSAMEFSDGIDAIQWIFCFGGILLIFSGIDLLFFHGNFFRGK